MVVFLKDLERNFLKDYHQWFMQGHEQWFMQGYEQWFMQGYHQWFWYNPDIYSGQIFFTLLIYYIDIKKWVGH